MRARLVVLFLSAACGQPSALTDAGQPSLVSYRPCASTNECAAGESCFSGFSNGLCSKACVNDADCGPDKCTNVSGVGVCLKSCAANSDCRTDLRCNASGTSHVCSNNVCATSKCSADPKPTQQQIEQCETQVADPNCLKQRMANLACSAEQQVCGSDNRTNASASAANISSHCRAEIDAYTACVTADAGVDGPDAGTGPFPRGLLFNRPADRQLFFSAAPGFLSQSSVGVGEGSSDSSLSPDGLRVVSVLDTGSLPKLQFVPNGNIGTTTLMIGSVQSYRQPVISPDGARIAFASDNGSGRKIVQIDVTGAGSKTLAGETGTTFSMPAFTPDRKSIIVALGTSDAQLTQLERVDLASGLRSSLTSSLGSEALAIAHRLVISPDGTKVAFDARVASGSTRIFWMDLTTKVVKKVNEYVNEPSTSDSYPSWYDNSSLVFGSNSGGSQSVYRVALDGSGRVLMLRDAAQPWYSPGH